MIIEFAYSDSVLSRRMQVILKSCFIWLFFIFFNILPLESFSQDVSDYDEISVFLDVPRVGGGEIAAVISGEELFLPVTDLFDFLKIRNIPSSGLDSVSGFFIDPTVHYLINRTDNSIKYLDKIFNLENGDMIRTESNLYLRSVYFGKVFGLECTFNFRSLSVTVNSRLELPIIREMKQTEMRKNLTRIKGEVKADTTISRSHPLFKFGMADWSATATEEFGGRTDTRLNIVLGSMIAGGEATASLSYNSTDPLTEKQQYYLWRYVNNDFHPLRQVMLGKIATNSISSIYNPVIGVRLTNTPTTYRRSFGSYSLSDKTEPGWIVELYVNNVLVDFVKADASGFFTFEVPLVYGNSTVKLKYLGPWGEERTLERNISIPFNFLPVRTLEYSVSAGFVEDSIKSRYSRVSINYGLTRSFTLGGGVEYLSSVLSSPAIPYLTSSLSITNNLLLSGEFSFGVRAKGTLSYRLPSNLQFDVDYIRYDKDQKAINNNYREERRVMVSMPLHIGQYSSYQRLSLYQIVLPTTKLTTAEWLYSGSVFGVNTNLTTYALFAGGSDPYLYSNLSLAFRLPGRLTIMPQSQYSYSQNRLISAKIGIEKSLFKHAYLNISYENNFRSNINMADIGFRYDFSFAQTGLSVRRSNKRSTLVQYARGSFIADRTTEYFGTDNRSNVGKGGISIVPFIDLNSNGIKDKGEPKAYGLNLHANGGRVEKNDRDTTIRILGLESYTSCFIELDQNSFDNISWRLPYKTLNVNVDPDILKLIEVPVIVSGESSGHVSLVKDGKKTGLGRIIISFYTTSNILAGKTLTEDDGYFSYMKLEPGAYSVRIDSVQMNKIDMISEPESLQFIINSGIDGDYVEGLDFILHKRSENSSSAVPDISEIPVIRKDTSYMVIHEVTQELVTITEDSYALQLGAFMKKSNAEVFRSKLEKLLSVKVEIIIENDFYKVRISNIKDRNAVDEKLSVLRNNGISELWLISLKAKQQQWILTNKQDTITEIRETVSVKPVVSSDSGLSLQVGAFRQEVKAISLKERLSPALQKQVIIVPEDGFFKVRITGFATPEEMKKFIPSLKQLGLKDFWQLPQKKEKIIFHVIQQPVAVIPDSAITVYKNEPEVIVAQVKPVTEDPRISIQVAVLYKRSQALHAQRKIRKKLNLPVEIVEKWDYYLVLVPGFYKREDTYQFYPELAGLGYPGVKLIEKK
jgi:cell division protein FtsN